jgi:hypothetical protein
MVELQKIFWKKVFSKMNMEKYATKGVMEKINQLSQSQQKIPFTMKNIYKLFEIIVGNSKNIYNQAICEAVDNFTKHIHENRYHVEGWKTNSGYMLNEKIIVPYIMEVAWGGKPSVRYGAYRENLEDLNKVLHNMLGEKYDHKNEIQHAFVKSSEPNQVGGRVNYEYYSFGEWVDWGFFKIKGFKKGTLHLKFKDKKHWELLNRAYAEAKGFSLPEKF